VEWNTIGSIVAMLAHGKWDIFHLDVRTTFLNGDLKEKVFMMQLERFFITGQIVILILYVHDFLIISLRP